MAGDSEISKRKPKFSDAAGNSEESGPYSEGKPEDRDQCGSAVPLLPQSHLRRTHQGLPVVLREHFELSEAGWDGSNDQTDEDCSQGHPEAGPDLHGERTRLQLLQLELPAFALGNDRRVPQLRPECPRSGDSDAIRNHNS